MSIEDLFADEPIKNLKKMEQNILADNPMLQLNKQKEMLFGSIPDYSPFGIIANSNNIVPTDFLLNDFTKKNNI